MAGMKDETGQGGRERCLAEDHLIRLQTMVDDEMAALDAAKSKPGDLITIERRTRAIGAMARTIKLVDGLRRKPGPSHDSEDTDMGEGDDDTDGCEADDSKLERIKAELERRLDRLAANIEKKRADLALDAGDGAGGVEPDMGAA